MHTVKLKHMRVHFRFSQIVDCYDLHICAACFDQGPQNTAPDPSKAVDCQFECHVTLRSSAGPDMRLG